MKGLPENQNSLVNIENVAIGESSSLWSRVIVTLTLFIPVFATVLFGGVDNTTWIFISITWAAIIFLWLTEAWKANGLLFNPSVLQVPLLGLLLIGLIQLLPLGGDTGATLSVPVSRALSLDPYATRFFVFHLVVYMIFFAACLTFINNEARLRKAFLLVIIFGAFMAFFGIMQRLANPDGIYGLRGTPQAIPFGPFINQHHFASFMQMTGGVTIGLLFGRKTGKDKKILLTIAVVIMSAATLMTSSRGGVLGFISVVAFIALLNFFLGRWSKNKQSSREANTGIQQKVVITASAVALAFVVFGLVLLLGGGEQLFRGIGVTEIQDGVTNGRAHFWPIAIIIFLEHPVLGAGFDAFGVAFTQHDTWNGMLRVEQAHNDYLQTLADSGITGFICIAAFIYFLFRSGLRTIAQTQGLRRDVAIGSLAGCFGILIHSFFDFPLRTPSNTFFFLLLCAMATVPVRSSSTESSRRRRSATAP